MQMSLCMMCSTFLSLTGAEGLRDNTYWDGSWLTRRCQSCQKLWTRFMRIRSAISTHWQRQCLMRPSVLDTQAWKSLLSCQLPPSAKATWAREGGCKHDFAVINSKLLHLLAELKQKMLKNNSMKNIGIVSCVKDDQLTLLRWIV